MRLQVDDGGSPRAVTLSIESAGATVADLAAQLELASDQPLLIDGVRYPASTDLTEVSFVDGTRIATSAAHDSRSDRSNDVWVGVVNGPGTGTVLRTDRGRSISVGRDQTNDLVIENTSVSSRHVALHISSGGVVEVEDLGSRNGTRIDGDHIVSRRELEVHQVVGLGSSSIRVVLADPRERTVGASNQHADPTGHILFNRPPRAPVSTGAVPVHVPQLAEVKAKPRLAVLSLLVPLVFAGAMVVALGSWRYALFGLLSPVMAIGNWASSRRQLGKERVRTTRREAEEIGIFKDELATAIDLERVRRRDFAPDMIEIRKRIELPTRRLWERRHEAVDAMIFRVGIGETSWDLPLDHGEGEVAAEVVAAETAARQLVGAEVIVDLGNGHLGVIGDSAAGTKLLQCVIAQLTAHHGPADLQLVVLTSRERSGVWHATMWLPHASQSGGPTSRVLCDDEANVFAKALAEQRADAQSRGKSTSPSWLVVVDNGELVRGRASAVRTLLADHAGVFGLVLAKTVDELPSSVQMVVEASPDDGEFAMWSPRTPDQLSTGILDLLTDADAADLFSAMARFHDTELDTLSGTLPSVVGAVGLHGEFNEPASIAERWARSRDDGSLRAAVGVGPTGRVDIDMVVDGPHALVAGTTGSGKSEFLRTLVAGLALENAPDRVVFVLIDYKGGSAFDRCGELPHVVGVVTDLDDHLAQRALQSLEAELHHRERVLRDANVSDIDGYHRAGSPNGSLPRLVVIIDEFATLRAELPEFVASLVSIAQRGRSLGVHLVLATQRPSGAVDANIRANTNLRVALRVQAPADSTDVVDAPVAAGIPRELPGRAFLRRGEGDLVAVQTGFLSGPLVRSASPFRIEPLVGDPDGRRDGVHTVGSDRDEEEAPTELDCVVEAVVAAASALPMPRRPWLDDLPLVVSPGEVSDLVDPETSDLASVPFLLGDDPSNQRRVIRSWSPARGHLAVVGVRGSGVSTTLRSVIAGLGNGRETGDGRPVAPWVFVADHGGGGLADIEGWPHVGCALEPMEGARHQRLMSLLEGEFDRRRGMSLGEVSAEPQIVLVVDGVAGFFETLGAEPASPMADLLARIGRDGPSLRIALVVGAERPSDIPRTLRSQIRETVVLEQAGPNDFGALGVSVKNLPTFVPGRALFGADQMVCQVIDHASSFKPECVVIDAAPPEVLEIAKRIGRHELTRALLASDVSVPIGREVGSHDEASLVIPAGDHALVAGPVGSGRTNALRTLAEQIREADAEVVLVGVVPVGGSRALLEADALDAGGTIDEIEHVVRMALSDERRWVIFVDDADRIDVDGGPLVEIARRAPSNVTLVVAMRTSAARGGYGHWTRFVRSSALGLLLSPDNSLDGEVFGVRLPRDKRVEPHPGRGYLVGAQTTTEIQVAECGAKESDNAS